MGKRVTDYPHTISFRLADEAWLGIQKEIAGSELTAHEWCRKAALERLNDNYSFSKAERFLLENFVLRTRAVLGHTRFSIISRWQFNRRSVEKLRAIATERAAELTDNALALRAKLSRERSR